MSDYADSKKQICFESTAKFHADLKIRLHHDEIKIKEFFNKMVQGYLEKNENLMAFVEEIKQTSQKRRNKIKKSRAKERNTNREFGLDKNDIENIFDILEKEYLDI